MKNLFIIGAGGHGRVVSDLARELDVYQDIFFLDDNYQGSNIKITYDFNIIGKVEDIKKYEIYDNDVIIAIGNNIKRVELLTWVQSLGFNVPILIHPTAYVSQSSAIGKGTVVMPRAVVNIGCTIGKGAIINSASVIEHDCNIGDGVHISPGAILAGTVFIGDYSWVCINASISNNLKIEENVTIAAGAVVLNNVRKNTLVAGVPAKVKGEHRNGKQKNILIPPSHGWKRDAIH